MNFHSLTPRLLSTARHIHEVRDWRAWKQRIGSPPPRWMSTESVQPMTRTHVFPERTRGIGALANPVLVSLALAIVTLLVYLPVRNHGFISLDDADYVSGNPMVQRGLSWTGVKWAFTTDHTGNWHPLTWLSHQLDAQIFGAGPSGPHLVNLLFHLANTLLLFFWLRRTTGALGRSAWVAAVFALHPLHVESVAWIAERKDVLSAFSFLLTLWAYVKYAESPPKKIPRRAWYAGALLLFGLGLMSKPMVVTLPVVLLLIDVWPLHRSLAQTWREKIPFFALSAASSVVTLVVQHHGGSVASLTNLSLAARSANAVVSYARYLGQLVWPHALAIFYPHPLHWATTSVVAAALLIAGLSAAALRWGRRLPFVGLGWWWFIVMLIPVIGLIQVGQQAMADRYAYLPSIGCFILLAWSANAGVARWSWGRIATGLAAMVTVVACGALTIAQLRHWRDSESVFRHAIAVTEKNHLAHNGLGYVLLEQGRLDEAVAEFGRALELQPAFAEAHLNLGNARLRQGREDDALVSFKNAAAARPDFAIAYSNLGVLLLRLGRIDEAVIALEKFAELEPHDATARLDVGNALLLQGKSDAAIARYREALLLDPGNPDAHNNLGNVLLQTGHEAAAIEEFQTALKNLPTHANAHYHLGEIALQRGELDEAEKHFQKTVAAQPEAADARRQLGAIALRKGSWREAAARYETALKLQPENISTLCDLAWLRATAPDATIRNGAQATTLAQQANRLTGSANPAILSVLAAAYAEAGRYAEASATARRALEKTSRESAPELAEMLSHQLKLYQANTPFHEVAPHAPDR
jgi:tetratricopeptide (TPR) repeat protein